MESLKDLKQGILAFWRHQESCLEGNETKAETSEKSVITVLGGKIELKAVKQ